MRLTAIIIEIKKGFHFVYLHQNSKYCSNRITEIKMGNFYLNEMESFYWASTAD